MGLAVWNHLPVEVGHLLDQVVILQEYGPIGTHRERVLVAGYRNPGIGCCGFAIVIFHGNTSFVWLGVRLTRWSFDSETNSYKIIIINNLKKILSLHASLFYGLSWSLFSFAVTANTKKIQAMTQYVKSGFIGRFRCYVLQGSQVRIDNLFAPDTDDMRMRKGLVAVVPVAPVGKGYFQHLVDLFKKMDRLVNGGDAGRRKLAPDGFIYLFHGGVPIADRQYSQNGQPLRRDPEIMLSQLRDHLIHALLDTSGIGMWFHLSSKETLY